MFLGISSQFATWSCTSPCVLCRMWDAGVSRKLRLRSCSPGLWHFAFRRNILSSFQGIIEGVVKWIIYIPSEERLGQGGSDLLELISLAWLWISPCIRHSVGNQRAASLALSLPTQLTSMSPCVENPYWPRPSLYHSSNLMAQFRLKLFLHLSLHIGQLSTYQHTYFSPEDGDCMFLRSVGIYLRVHNAVMARDVF
jgi:hypothetical protein